MNWLRFSNPLAAPQATYTGWSCPAGPAEFVDYLVDPDHAEDVSYEEFATHVDLSTAPLDPGQIEMFPTDWHITWLKTRLPSGEEAWVMQHSGIEHLFLIGGDFDHSEEARLADAWAEAQ